MTTKTLPSPVFINPESNYNQYRPAVDATGKTVIFERTPTAGGDTLLYTMTLGQSPTPVMFLQVTDPPASQTRPDICWGTGQVAFNGASSNQADVYVVIANSNGTKIANVPSSTCWFYPAWSADTSVLAVMNHSDSASPKPSTSLVNTNGKIVVPNLDGDLSNSSTAMFGGMAAAYPTSVNLVAYAGQPDTSRWHGHPVYDQDFNYVFVNSPNNSGTFSSTPLEPGAPTDKFDPSYQGRAPAWSPDGRWVVFESNRLGDYALFLFDTKNPSNGAVQIIDTRYGAQHAKFMPNGTSLVLCAHPTGKAPWAIATLDICAFVS